MKIEILYAEVANIYGELSAVKYLSECLPDAEFIYTSINDTPSFVNENVSFVFLGPMTESSQELVIEKLRPYTQCIRERIDEGVFFLCVGNALEIFISYIQNEDGSQIQALDIFSGIYAKRQMMNRYNSLYLGTFEDMKIVGFKAQFSHSYGDNSGRYFCNTIRGDGLNPQSKLEGIRKNNFIGTYLLGPLLIMNPEFTKYILKTIGAKPVLAFEETAMSAYKTRLDEFTDTKLRYK